MLHDVITQRHRRQLWFGCAALFAVTLLAFAPAMFAGYVWDDPDHIANNITLRSLSGLWDIWTNWNSIPQWYPLTHTSFWIQYQWWGAWAPGYHITNIILH